MHPARNSLLRFAVGALLSAVVSPAAVSDETLFKAYGTPEGRFPPALIAQGITSGEVWVLVNIDADGQLTDALVSRYTHRLLVDEALRLLRGSRYQPVRVNGEPVGVTREVHLRLEATGCVISLDATTTVQQLARSFTPPRYHKNIFHASDLDTLPAPTHRVPPLHPGRLPDMPVRSGTAVVEFVIDETGRPRLPALVSAPHPEFGYRAAEALAQWQFTPPLRDGRPVAVRVRQEFVFPET